VSKIKPLDPIVPCAAYLGACGTLLGSASIFGIAEHWRPAWSNWAGIAVAVLFLTWAARLLAGWRFGQHRDLRQALLALAAQDRKEVWLNRDAHLVFWSSRVRFWPLQAWSVTRLNEDVIGELDTAEPVRTAVTYEQFAIFPFTRGIVRSDEAVMVTRGAEGDVAVSRLPGTPGMIRSLWRTLRMPRGIGTTWAQPDEVRELITQFRAAESIGSRS
jgi:hypothetical protein